MVGLAGISGVLYKGSMPIMQGVIERLNAVFHRKHIREVDPALLAPGASLSTAARKVGAARALFEREFIDSWPPALQETIRAAIYSALTRKPRIPVTFSWAPGYDFEVSIWEAAGTQRTMGGITIHLRSRYPDDHIPGLKKE
jgi:hypothetical protein